MVILNDTIMNRKSPPKQFMSPKRKQKLSPPKRKQRRSPKKNKK